MKPSNFTERPWNSVLNKDECETIARNIMLILKRTGDTFRELTWEEYAEERQTDSGFTTSEQEFFNQVIKYCSSVKEAIKFSPQWQKAAAEYAVKSSYFNKILKRIKRWL